MSSSVDRRVNPLVPSITDKKFEPRIRLISQIIEPREELISFTRQKVLHSHLSKLPRKLPIKK